MSIYTAHTVPEGKEVFAFAYSVRRDRSGKKSYNLHQLPISGFVFHNYFEPKTSPSNRTWKYNRTYADTYEEAVECYNGLVSSAVEDEILYLNDIKKDLIE